MALLPRLLPRTLAWPETSAKTASRPLCLRPRTLSWRLWLRARRRLKGLKLGRQWLKFPWRATFRLPHEADWQALVKEALKGAPLSSLRSTSYDGIVIEPLYARAKDGNRHSRPRARRGLGGHAAHRSARCRSRQHADPRRSEQRRERHRARVRGRGRRLRLCPSGDGSGDRGGAQGRASRLRAFPSSSISVRRRGKRQCSSPTT